MRKDVFNTWHEFLEFVERATPATKMHRSHAVSFKETIFRGTANFAEAIELARSGWADGESRVNAISAQILSQVTSLIERQHIDYDVTGMAIDMGAYLTGEPHCWQTQTHTIEDGAGVKHVRLVFNGGASGGINAETLIAKGATVAALVQSLEAASIRVELWALCTCATGERGTPPDYECRVLIKRADQHLDMGRIVFALAHPSMLRRLGFAARESYADVMQQLGRRIPNGYGYSCETTDQGDIYIAKSGLWEPEWCNVASAVNWVKKMLREQGVILNEA